MSVKNDEKINGFLFVAVLPFLLFAMSYYGFESSYVRLKAMEKAPDFMFTSVYAYRVIPNYLSVHVTELVTFIVNHYIPFLKTFLLKQGTLFYHSIFLINSFFFILSSIVLHSLLKLNLNGASLPLNIRRMIHLLAVFLLLLYSMCLPIVTVLPSFLSFRGIPYIEISAGQETYRLYSSVFVGIYFYAGKGNFMPEYFFFAAMCIDVERLKKKDFTFIMEILFLVIAFIVPYAGLRIMIHQDVSLVEGIYFLDNFSSPFNISGLLFGGISLYFSYLLCNDKGKIFIRKYLFFSIPYLIMIAMVGLFWETRLFLPLILTGIMTAAHRFKNIVSQQ